MMKLAIVSPYPPSITGIGQYGYHFGRALAHSGQFTHTTILAGAQTGPSRTGPKKVEVSDALTVDFTWQPNQLGTGPAITAALARLNPDLVWYNLGASVFGRSPLVNLLSFLSLSRANGLGIPAVVTLHELVELADLKSLNAPGGRLARLGASLLTHLSTRADVVCLTMRRYVDWLSARKPGLRCFYIPIGAYQTPERLPEIITPEAEGPELLFFTTLAPYKGLEILLAAYQSLLAGYPNLRLTIAGAEHPRFPGYGESLRRDYADLPGICWLGQVPEARIRAMFTRAQIVVLPYNASTGSSSVLYQAAMWGRALVASDLPEMMTVAAESGLQLEVFKNRDPASLARAIQTLLDAPARRRDQVEHNYAAIQRIRPEATCRLYLQAFNQALETHHSPERLAVPAASLEST